MNFKMNGIGRLVTVASIGLAFGLMTISNAAKAAKAADGLLDAVSTPEDIAQGIMAMVTADKVTGHTLVVDAGHTVGPRLGAGI